ncbi:hypothetical protein EUTSA_v10017330mg [Eutrema salsugineum]|uniref:Uncharacterized protein n=1 Tax=Eutrema salsugineum TaxID=72664 RepID=V4MHX8_EUTSA|nr:uncharacterized protein LOC18027093 [Eutrema salsugineum]ESQ52158.1 hypothetical protein EUTSA_v10017330mg [Eutrema salsugineum]
MQRLSLDSSASKLYSYGGRKDDTYDIDDLKRKESASSPPSSSSSPADYDDHELKDFKPRRLSLQSPFAATHQKQEKLVHFIPVLTLICFIILYLSSHAPSQSDLAQFNGFMRPSKHLDSDENGDISGFIRSDTLAIRSSIRNLQETESYATKSLPRRRTSHRKTADF